MLKQSIIFSYIAASQLILWTIRGAWQRTVGFRWQHRPAKSSFTPPATLWKGRAWASWSPELWGSKWCLKLLTFCSLFIKSANTHCVPPLSFGKVSPHSDGIFYLIQLELSLPWFLIEHLIIVSVVIGSELFKWTDLDQQSSFHNFSVHLFKEEFLLSTHFPNCDKIANIKVNVICPAFRRALNLKTHGWQINANFQASLPLTTPRSSSCDALFRYVNLWNSEAN